MRAVAASAAQVVCAELEVGPARQQRVGLLVIECRPFELEEQQLGLERGAALLHQLQQRATRRVGGVSREPQHRVTAGAVDEFQDRGEFEHRLAQSGSVE